MQDDLKIVAQKRALREGMKIMRDREYTKYSGVSGEIIAPILGLVASAARVVALYYPFGSEMDCLPLAEALRAAGYVTALPVVVTKGQALRFRQYETGDPFMQSRFGVSEPSADATEVEPDTLIVPLLAFDRERYRLGYGGGFYDRTLVELRAKKSILAIGLGFSFQQVVEVPRETHDARLDEIVTELGIF